MKTQILKVMQVLVITVLVSGCADRLVAPPAKQGGGAVSSYRQIERLGRPAINEGLVITNDYLNAYNAIGPNLDLSSAAAPVVSEVATVFGLVRSYALSVSLNPPTLDDVVAGFLPDVMRIDTNAAINVGTTAYNGSAVIVAGTGSAMLTGGRKIEDDVIDITLSYLFHKDASGLTIKDGVSYGGGTLCANAGQGTNPAAPGHKCLEGQTVRNGTASFPFLARPN